MPPSRLRVVTYNIHGGRPLEGPANLRAIANVLRELDADLVGLQEVHRNLPPPGVPQDQPAFLRKLLDYHVTFRRSFGAGPVGYGNAILSRAAPEHVRLYPLPGGGEPRALLEVRLTLDRRPLRFLSTHFTLNPADRVLQARRLVEVIASDPIPTVLAADLNGGPDSPELDLLTPAGLVHCAPPELLTFPCDRPSHRIDYLMTTPHFRTREAWTVPTPSSDHLPLIADLDWVE